jgi:predicted metal-binding membrane protein
MARIPRELTPEERAQLEKDNKRQYSIVAAVIWTLCSVAWAVTLYIDFANHNPVLTIALHGLCAVLTATSAVLHFVRWRKMKVADATPVDADSADTP